MIKWSRATMGFSAAVMVSLIARGQDPPDRSAVPPDIPTVAPTGELVRNGKPYRAVGVNYFSAFSRTLADPKDTSYRNGFAELAKRGIPFARFMACGFWPDEMKLYGDNREDFLTRLDAVIKAAEETGVGLVPSLFWYSACVPDLVGEPRSQWGNPESKTIAFMRRYTKDIVSRYLNSPAIWAWEFGNEFSLAVDLPNAADHRPWVVPEKGTPVARSEADDLKHDMILVALREFAGVVREIDKTRPITSGNSLPRPAAHHLRTEATWTQDTREQFAANLIEVNPDPVNLISIHIYPFEHHSRFGQEYTSYEEIIALCSKAARQAGKALFIGEFGAQDDEEHGGPAQAREELEKMFLAIEASDAALAALWVFDFPHQESYINVSLTNHRAYILDRLAEANRRLQASPDSTQSL